MMIATEYKGAPLMGICAGDYERIDSILSKADSLSSREKTESIAGCECYVIDAATKRGGYTVWIDPNHGYNIAKVQVQRKTGDLIGDGQYQKTDMSFSLENVRFEEINDVWVPMQADMQQIENDGAKTTKWHHKRTQIILNPDFQALKAFVPDDIPDGTKVLFPGEYGTEYKWQNGAPVAQVKSNVER